MNDLEFLLNFLGRTNITFEIRENRITSLIEVLIDQGNMIITFDKNRKFNYYDIDIKVKDSCKLTEDDIRKLNTPKNDYHPPNFKNKEGNK